MGAVMSFQQMSENMCCYQRKEEYQWSTPRITKIQAKSEKQLLLDNQQQSNLTPHGNDTRNQYDLFENNAQLVSPTCVIEPVESEGLAVESTFDELEGLFLEIDGESRVHVLSSPKVLPIPDVPCTPKLSTSNMFTSVYDDENDVDVQPLELVFDVAEYEVDTLETVDITTTIQDDHEQDFVNSGSGYVTGDDLSDEVSLPVIVSDTGFDYLSYESFESHTFEDDYDTNVAKQVCDDDFDLLEQLNQQNDSDNNSITGLLEALDYQSSDGDDFIVSATFKGVDIQSWIKAHPLEYASVEERIWYFELYYATNGFRVADP